MRNLFTALICAVLTLSAPASAQVASVNAVQPQAYPSPGAPGMVPLACDNNAANCLPSSPGNPLPVQMREDAAFRAGRAFTISTGKMTDASGNVACLYVQNTSATNTYFITSRLFTDNLPSNVASTAFFSIANPTANLPTQTGTATSRNGSGTLPGAVIRYGVSTAANQPTGTVGPGNLLPMGQVLLGEPFGRAILPGASFTNCIEGAGTGLTGNTDMVAAITFTLYYE